MNLILFEEHERGVPLPKRDPRAVHLLKVLHKTMGDYFDAGVLGGKRGVGCIKRVNSDGSIEVSLDLREEPPPRLLVRLAVGFPRPIQIRRLLRDMANMGVEAIDLMGTELGEKSYRDTTLLTNGGARDALIEGAVQARDTLLPVLAVYPSLGAWLAARPWHSVSRLIAADNIRPVGIFSRLTSKTRTVVIAVGSERGWSEQERERLESAGFTRLSLGDRALRTETACVVAVALATQG
ncbi:MAG: 16S rRNA (uracil(1498)-N(3))-methyltransferase [Treponema sp.]|nr:16S rRNA (uracil(1498)-N(3))-methyltransferase [Treponema sp.]